MVDVSAAARELPLTFVQVAQLPFAGGTLEMPVLRLPALCLTLAALLATFRCKLGVAPLLEACAVAALALRIGGTGWQEK